MIESPPYFHPEQAAAAVDAGKHVYLAKPMAVDVPGCMTIAETGKKATARKLVCLIDFQTRANDLYLETLRRVHQGDIGRLVSAVASYPWAGTVHDDHTAASPEERLRLPRRTSPAPWTKSAAWTMAPRALLIRITLVRSPSAVSIPTKAVG